MANHLDTLNAVASTPGGLSGLLTTGVRRAMPLLLAGLVAWGLATGLEIAPPWGLPSGLNAPREPAQGLATVWAGPDSSGPFPAVKVYFGPRPADDPQGLLVGMTDFIDQAQRELLVSIHEIDMVLIAERLAARAQAGVDVRVVVESQWWSQRKCTAAREVLENAGVVVIPDTKIGGLMHNKFMVADGRRVWTGSTNMTLTCLLYNPNNAIAIEDPRIAANYVTEFVEEQAGRFGKKGSGPPNTPHPRLRFDTGEIGSYFAPEDPAVEAIVEAIAAARHQIEVMVFVFSSEPISQAILEAHRRGVKVRILLDNAFASPRILDRWTFVPYRTFKAAGVAVHYDDEASKLHHKVVVIDSQTVITGSFNLSAAAALDNDENILVIRHGPTAQRYQAEFDRLWAQYVTKRDSTADDAVVYSEPEPGDEQQ